jgi:hypothetical protein
MENSRHSILVHELKREKVGSKICEFCKNEILKTQWYNTLDVLNTDFTDRYIRFYFHENCFDKYLKIEDETT